MPTLLGVFLRRRINLSNAADIHLHARWALGKL